MKTDYTLYNRFFKLLLPLSTLECLRGLWILNERNIVSNELFLTYFKIIRIKSIKRLSNETLILIIQSFFHIHSFYFFYSSISPSYAFILYFPNVFVWPSQFKFSKCCFNVLIIHNSGGWKIACTRLLPQEVPVSGSIGRHFGAKWGLHSIFLQISDGFARRSCWINEQWIRG